MDKSFLFKIDRSFDGFFSSFGVAIVLCTLLVSIGKSIAYYYFVYVILAFLIILFGFASYNYYVTAEKNGIGQRFFKEINSSNSVDDKKRKKSRPISRIRSDDFHIRTPNDNTINTEQKIIRESSLKIVGGKVIGNTDVMPGTLKKEHEEANLNLRVIYGPLFRKVGQEQTAVKALNSQRGSEGDLPKSGLKKEKKASNIVKRIMLNTNRCPKRMKKKSAVQAL